MIQPMPDLTPEQLAALREDIAANGVLVPIVVDQHGRILDGNNRAAIAAELGIDLPKLLHQVVDDDDAEDVAVRLNCQRRHLSREQRRQVIRREIERRPQDSDRAIARRVACSPSTVGAVRREVSNLDTPERDLEWAEDITNQLRDATNQMVLSLNYAALIAMTAGVEQSAIIGALIRNRRTFEKDEITLPFAAALFDDVIDAVLDQSNIEFWRRHRHLNHFTDDELAFAVATLEGTPYKKNAPAAAATADEGEDK